LASVRRWVDCGFHHPFAPTWSRIARGLVTLGSAFTLILLYFLGRAFAFQEPLGDVYGLPSHALTLLKLTLLLPLIVLGLIACSVKAWGKPDWRIMERVHYSLVAISLFLIFFELQQRNLIFGSHWGIWNLF
jgi:hypothetical protein